MESKPVRRGKYRIVGRLVSMFEDVVAQMVVQELVNGEWVDVTALKKPKKSMYLPLNPQVDDMPKRRELRKALKYFLKNKEKFVGE